MRMKSDAEDLITITGARRDRRRTPRLGLAGGRARHAPERRALAAAGALSRHGRHGGRRAPLRHVPGGRACAMRLMRRHSALRPSQQRGARQLARRAACFHACTYPRPADPLASRCRRAGPPTRQPRAPAAACTAARARVGRRNAQRRSAQHRIRLMSAALQSAAISRSTSGNRPPARAPRPARPSAIARTAGQATRDCSTHPCSHIDLAAGTDSAQPRA
jgi:hypothetical protein